MSPEPFPNPLSTLSNADLWNSQLALLIACGRSHSSLKGKHKQYFCGLAQVLKIESIQRGKAFPTTPISADAKLPPGAL